MSDADPHDGHGEGKIEYEPHADPTMERNGYLVYVYENDDSPVPDLIITRTEGDERFRLWGFQAHQGLLVLVNHTDHRHPPDYDDDVPCRKWTTFSDDGWPGLREGPGTPEDVSDIAIRVSDAPVIDRSKSGGVDR